MAARPYKGDVCHQHGAPAAWSRPTSPFSKTKAPRGGDSFPHFQRSRMPDATDLGIYAASKAAVRALAEATRRELRARRRIACRRSRPASSCRTHARGKRLGPVYAAAAEARDVVDAALYIYAPPHVEIADVRPMLRNGRLVVALGLMLKRISCGAWPSRRRGGGGAAASWAAWPCGEAVAITPSVAWTTTFVFSVLGRPCRRGPALLSTLIVSRRNFSKVAASRTESSTAASSRRRT